MTSRGTNLSSNTNSRAKNPIAAWIHAGYKEFAENGPEPLVLNSISRCAGVPRTSFYYLFKDKKEFIQALLDRHEHLYAQFNFEIASVNYLEETLFLNSKYQDTLRFHKQLLINRHVSEYRLAYEKEYRCIAKAISPIISKMLKKEGNETFRDNYFNTLIDLFFSKMNVQDLSQESIRKQAQVLIEEINKIF